MTKTKTAIPQTGIVILSRSGCEPCKTLQRILKNKGREFKVVDVEKEKLPIINVPQMYYNGKYKFTGVPDVMTIMRSIR